MHVRQMRFGLIAVELGWISEYQLAQARKLWKSQNRHSLAEIIEASGWITSEQGARIRQLLMQEPAALVNASTKTVTASVDDGPSNSAGAPNGSRNGAAPPGDRLPAAVPPLDAGDDQDYMVGSDTDSRIEYDGESSWRPAIPEGSRYQLGRLYAEGGLSRVWIAHDSNLNRKVALKQMRRELVDNRKALRRFRNEAQIAGQLNHPNIVSVYEFCCDERRAVYYYTMRLVHGKTLRNACDEYHRGLAAGNERHLEMTRLLQVFISVCQAIAYANTRGVIHRDIKPENVVLGKFGEVVVLDWGLAKTIDVSLDGESSDSAARKIVVESNFLSEQTVAGVVLGTPAYMAPEQARPELAPVDERTDVYGLGSTLYVILTGRAPHKAGSVKETLEQVASVPLRRPREVQRNVPPALDAICAKATAFRASDRYATAAEIALDVQRYLADEPTSVYNDPQMTQARRWIERNRITFLIGMSILPIITLLLLIWNISLQRQLREAGPNQIETIAASPQVGLDK